MAQSDRCGEYIELSLCYRYHKCYGDNGDRYADDDVGGKWFAEHQCADKDGSNRLKNAKHRGLCCADIARSKVIKLF